MAPQPLPCLLFPCLLEAVMTPTSKTTVEIGVGIQMPPSGQMLCTSLKAQEAGFRGTQSWVGPAPVALAREPHRSHLELRAQLFRPVAHRSPPSPSGCQSCVSDEGEWGAGDPSPALPALPHFRQGVHLPPNRGRSEARVLWERPLPHWRLTATELSHACPRRPHVLLSCLSSLPPCVPQHN